MNTNDSTRSAGPDSGRFISGRRHVGGGGLTAALAILLACAGPASDPSTSAGSTDKTVVTDSTTASTACRDPDNTLITGGRVGGLEVGAPVDAVRRDCTVVGDTVLLLEGSGQPALLVDVGGDAVIAEIVDGSVWRINVVTPGPATVDSLRVGTPVRRLAQYDSARIAYGEGQFVLIPSKCGLSFGIGGLPAPPGRRWTMDDLTGLPDSARVTRILVLPGRCDG